MHRLVSKAVNIPMFNFDSAETTSLQCINVSSFLFFFFIEQLFGWFELFYLSSVISALNQSEFKSNKQNFYDCDGGAVVIPCCVFSLFVWIVMYIRFSVIPIFFLFFARSFYSSQQSKVTLLRMMIKYTLSIIF